MLFEQPFVFLLLHPGKIAALQEEEDVEWLRDCKRGHVATFGKWPLFTVIEGDPIVQDS